MISAVQVTGLREVRRALEKAGRTVVAELRTELVATTRPLVAEIKSTIPSKTGRAARSIRVTKGSTRGGVKIDLKGGGARVPYYGWLEFGGQLPTHHPNDKRAMSWGGASHPSASARGANRSKVAQGRYMRPAVRRHESDLRQAAEDAFRAAARRAGLI